MTLTDLAIPRTNSINVTAIAKDDVTLTSAEPTTTDDGPSLEMLERCRAYAADPPPADWRGDHVLTSK